ncbi:hypothetical protein AALP_AA4G043600 [Arabis alpina]|uniref:RRM domain-containing protein n=1 Tax=Arabis alpina TaxID=50452 RepID=A0A087H135_ARAAL|nr:hypothetical protein AALP_AA4G043600 [Arabis alpina]
MGKELKRLKRCSTSTDAEASDHKDKKPLQIAESELQSSVTDVKKRKKKSKSKQIDEEDDSKSDKEELTKSFKEMTQAMKNLHDFFTSNSAALPGLKEIWLKASVDASSKKEEAPKKTEELATFECCFESEDSEGPLSHSVLVKGFDTCHSRDDIKTALWKHFESCGCEVVRVFVPIECKTGVPLGFAFVYVDDSLKAISLGCGYMGERHLRVMMAKYQPESTAFPNFHGCKRCGRILAKRRMRRFVDVNGLGGVWV